MRDLKKNQALGLTFLIHQFGFAVHVAYFVGTVAWRHLVEKKKERNGQDLHHQNTFSEEFL